jgi:hypothetical protein
MNPLNGLTEYLEHIERRLRMLAVSRGAAWTAGAALAFTVLGVLIANYFAFSPPSVFGARLVLFLALAGAFAVGLIVPLLRLNRRAAAREAERQCPQFEQRLVTFAERAERPDPFLELLAADTLGAVHEAQPRRIAPQKRILGFASAGALAAVVLLWLAISGVGFLGYGTKLLWGAIPRELQPFYEVQVQPGNHTIRRKSDQLVTARLRAFQTSHARVFAKFQSSSKWEEAQMTPQPGANGFEFLFTGVPEAFEYYVEAGGVRSNHYRVDVVDLPEVKKLRVTYHYPSWTDLKETVEDPGGDLRAVEGTEAEIKVITDRPLSGGSLLLDDGTKIDLHDGIARVPMQKDGAYHVATAERGEAVRLSNDYFIEVQKAMPPKVHISRPGRDAKVNPIEEVTIQVQAEDDFALRGMDLHYSVNGGPEKTVALGGSKGKKAEGSTTLYLEDHKLIPGDIVSFYATARNAIATNRTDMFFIQAEPFERTYTQSQQMGGEGGGQQMPDVSAHQKEIVSATWNQVKNPPKDKTAEEENAKVLSSVQSKLRDQAKSLASRMQVRDMSAANAAVKSFADDMAQAVEAMDQAAAKLSTRDWQGALAPEQKSFQHLSRAEATFRDIQVAMGASNGGGGFGTGRDLEGMFDLELDREKNQYETGQNAASPEQRRKDMEEILAKLEELARRQQELAEQRKQNQQAYEQRWQQELLKREAEELRRKMEEMARSQSSQLSRDGQQGQQSDGQSGQQSQQTLLNGKPLDRAATQSAAMNRAIERLKQAARDMQNTGSPMNQGGQQSEAEARQAVERLREAREMLAGARKEQATEEVKDFAHRSEQLAQEQQEFENTVRHSAGSSGQDLGPGQMSMRQPRNMRDQGGPLTTEQQKLLDELTKLEEDMQRSARDMAGSQPAASSKLREALGEMQQQELRLKMKWSLEIMRRGIPDYALPREMSVTQGLNQLRDRLREAQNALNRQQPGQGQNVEAALARAEQLRRELEQMKSAAEGRQSQAKGGQQKGNQAGQEGQGQQPGQGQGQQGQGQQGQAPGDQPGEMAQGQGSQSGGSPQQGGGNSSGIQQGDGHAGPGAGEFWGHGVDSAYADRVLRNGIRDLTQAEQLLRGNQDISRDTNRDVQDLIRQMQRLNPRLLAADPSRLSAIVGQLVDSVDQVELELRRVADAQQSGSVRSGAAQPAPPGYADAVAEYFRRLAAQK